ncbi:hypothetical protein VTN77DRAFT_178 [Rasamsonia byssochlamydoides]|uniref:uncharacterized protein n=1 Tax=Rasamsonia byssochlamydoides TaxID=89139 RepID=UPI003742913B
MHLSNAELGQVLRLELSGEKRRHLHEDKSCQKHLFYIRSWTFTPLQLYSLVRCMKQDGHAFPELDELESVSFITISQNLTTRYIGTTKGRRTPFRRFSDDLVGKPKASLLGAFQDYLERVFPEIFHTAEVHMLPDASLEIFGDEHQIGNPFNADDTERLLIHLFGHYSLINYQLGGHYISYLRSAGDDDLLRSLQINYFRNFLTKCNPFPEHEWLSLTDHFAMIRNHAQKMGYS